MWARALHTHVRQHSWRTAPRPLRFIRQYNGSVEAPHTTYFQPPPQPPKPPRRILRTVLWSSTCFAIGAFCFAWYATPLELASSFLDEIPPEDAEELIQAGGQDNLARSAPELDLDLANCVLESRVAYTASTNAVGHTCQVPSNLPCEDAWASGSFTVLNDRKRDWSEWSIYDGHAGPRTSYLLKNHLSLYVGSQLWEAKCMGQPYTPNDQHIVRTIKRAFLTFDHDMIETAAAAIMSDNAPKSAVISTASAAFSGSCALMALYDPFNSVLRVANVGDSRAVLGRWDSKAQKYVAMPMSVDQKGFNQAEADRINQEHPGEQVINPETGRVHGIAVTRAFGDARWKWPAAVVQRAHDLFWGPKPRPNGVIKTPPYLTAEPEVMETRVQAGQNPDFLIMASDGLWDLMSSEDAVECVNLWLKQYSPTMFFEHQEPKSPIFAMGHEIPARNWSSQSQGNAASDKEDEDTYYDEGEEALQWRVSPKHFVVEDINCGAHLVRNALGGKRRDLFTSILSVQPPLSRNMRDDITVQVIFFGQDVEPFFEKGEA